MIRAGIGRLLTAARAAFVPAQVSSDPDAVRRAGMIIAFSAILVPTAAVRCVTLLIAQLTAQAGFVAFLVLTAAAAPLVMKKTGSVRLAGELLTGTLFVVASRLVYQRGGIGTAAAIGIGALPLVATFLSGPRSGLIWTALVLLELGAFAVLRASGVTLPDRARAEHFALEVTGALLFPLVMFGLGLAYEWTKAAALSAKSTAELERARAEQESSILRADRMASVGQLAAGVAHEANNPLGYVTANLAFIQERLAVLDEKNLSSMRPELEEALAEARQGADRIARVVRDLKAYARPAAEEASDSIDLKLAIEAALKMAHSELRHRAQVVRTYADAPHVTGDETRLTQVFLNLLLNAAHALPEGHASEHRVEIKLAPDGPSSVVVEVIDSGSGIAPEHLPRVTDPFFTTKPHGVGTGLGLAVCKQIVEAMNGQLEIESTLGEGTTVRVSFRAAPGESARAIRVVTRPGASDTRYKILIVDDDPLVLKGLCRMLRDHELTAVGSGHEALEVVASGAAFDAILCDVMMPELTGIDVYDRVQELSPGLARRIVFLSGGVSTGPTAERLELVDNLRLDKPVDAGDLATTLGMVVTRCDNTDAA